jgi:type IV pilus assembly protein PilM
MLEAMTVAGVRPIGIDHSAFGMIRALAREVGSPVGPGQFVSAPAYEERVAAHASGAPSVAIAENHAPAKLFCNLGDVTNLAVARGSSCLFTRIASFGVEGIAQKLAERRRLTVEHSRQWLTHVGLEQPLEALEGDPEHVSAARECLGDGAARLADELRVSMDYYAAQEGAVPIEGIVVCGPGTRIPGMVERLQRSLGHAFSVAKPAALGHLDDADAVRQTLSFGLALEQ